MERLDFRDAVAEKFNERFGKRDDCRAMFENGPTVDMNNLTVPVVAYEIVYDTSEQADLAEVPRIKDEGTILVTVLVKEMAGNRTAYALRDEAADLLQRHNITGAVTQVARLLANSYTVKGWVGYRAAIPFWHYHD